MPILVIVSTIIFLGLCVFSFSFPNQIPFATFVVLGLTLIVLVWYAYDTHRIANQTLESNLRPVVLRSGYIHDWTAVQFTIESSTINGTPLQFMVLKNIVKNIGGYIILNKHKYTLLFGSSISQIANSKSVLSSGSSSVQQIAYNDTWGWLAPDNTLSAVFDPTKYQSINQPNEIYITYQDIESNRYFTMENENFLSTSGTL